VYCSLNEIQGMALKATRGAGLSWGMAQEASGAARWLMARDLPGLESLASLLGRLYSAGETDFIPATDEDVWQSQVGWLPGLHAGVAFLDLAGEIEEEGDLTLKDVAEPLLFLPFAAAATLVCDRPLAISWPGCEKMVSAGDIVGAVPIAQLANHAPALEVRVVNATPPLPAPKPEAESVSVDDAVWARLNGFAKRTYVPESDESRERGAGAGGIDND
jgi:hypothetical protein